MTRRSHGTRTGRTEPTAFVLHLGIPGLGAVRSLGRAGVRVVGMDQNPANVGYASRYCEATLCPHPARDPERLLEFMLQQGRLLSEPGILSPAADAYVLFMSRYREALGESFRFNLPSPETIEACLDKRELYALADRVGVPHATTFYPETLDAVHRIKDDLEYPAYIKPYHSHLWRAAFPALGKGVKVATPTELVSWFARILPTGVQVMVQSIIVGPATNVRSVRVYITPAGELIAAFTNRKIRQNPVEFGVATVAESIHDPALLEMGIKFFKDIDYRGFGLIEFKQDDRDGVLKLTDLNPRWLKTVNIATDSRIDFPLLHYRDLAGEAPESQFDFKAGVRWLDAQADFASAWELYRAGALSLPDWARSWLGARSFATFALDDPMPFLKEYRYGKRLVRAPLHLWRYR